MNPYYPKNSTVKIFENHPRFQEFLPNREVKQINYVEVERSALTADTNNMPSTVQQINNAAKAATRVIQQAASGQPIRVSMQKYIDRMSVCNTCEYLNNFRCAKCGCQLMAKAMLETEKCPVGKW